MSSFRINFLLINLMVKCTNVFALGIINQLAEGNVTQEILTNRNYDKTIRPDLQVSIYLDLVVNQIIAIDEKNQQMTSSINLALSWRDARLSWLDTEYKNISDIFLPGELFSFFQFKMYL